MSAETDWSAVADSVYREFVEDERREKAQQHLEELQEEIERLRAELQNAAKAALDAVALSCEKEREADALRVDAERYRWLSPRILSADFTMTDCVGLTFELPKGSRVSPDADKTIDAAMGASA